jgi:ABC-type multidrug transport system fused ATPase/permease subunit
MLRASLLFSLVAMSILNLTSATEELCPESESACAVGTTQRDGSEADASAFEGEASDDSVLLQTLHQMEYHKGVASSSSMEEVEQSSSSQPSNVCTGTYLDLLSYDTRLDITSLPSIADFTVKRDCTPKPSRISLLAKSAAVAQGPQISRSTSAFIAVGFFGAFVFLLVFYLFRTVVFPGMTKERLDEQAKTRPEQVAWNSGWISWFSMNWVDVWMAHWGTAMEPSKTTIGAAQLGLVTCEGDEATENGKILEKLWREQAPEKSQYDLLKVVIRFMGYRKLVFVSILVAIYQSMLFLAPALAIRSIITALEDVHLKYSVDPSSVTSADCFEPTVFVLAIFIGGGIILFACDTLSFMILTRNNMRLRSGLNAICFAKAQRLHGSTSEFYVESISGQPPVQYSIVSLINNDINNGLNGIFVSLFNCMFFVPVMGVLFVLMCQTIKKGLFFTMGASTVLLGSVFVCAIGQAKKLKHGTDLHGMRVSLCQEIFQGIRLIKAYAWEIASMRMLSRVRKMELEQIYLYYRWTGAFSFVTMNVPRLMVLSSIAGYVFMYGDIDAVTIFTLMQILRCFNSALRELSNVIPNLARIYPCLVRLQTFLHLPESEKCARLPQDVSKSNAYAPGDVVVRTKGCFTWNPDLPAFLKDIDVEVKQGELVAIVGEVGSGKTALITAMLGEMFASGQSVMEGPDLVAYHAQVPMISEGTLHDNIVFWRDFDKERYDAVLKEACLLEDLAFLPGHDECSIGHRGIALSGGQRARVSLARCAYSKNAELMLIDDPFSSVDMHTADHLMNNMLLSDALKKKTRVVVTQPDIDRLQHFDRVIVMKKGEIAIEGRLEEVQEHEAFVSMLKRNRDGTTLQPPRVETSRSTPEPSKKNSSAKAGGVSKDAPAIRDEEFEGRADWSTMEFFLGLGGPWNVVGIVVFFVLVVVFGMLADIVLAQWGSAEMHGVHRPTTFLFAYTFWTGVGMLAFAPMWYCASYFGINISDQVFEILCKNLLGAPIDSFHDRQPLGRILNRLSTDLLMIDYKTIFMFMATLAMIFFYFIPVTYIHTVLPYWFTLMSIPFYVILFYVLSRYWNLTVPLRYLTSVTKSTLSAYSGDVGVMRTTLRAYGICEKVAEDQNLAVDANMKTDMASNVARKWVIVRLGLLYISFLTSIVLLSVWFPASISIGTTGLCISYCLSIICDLEFQLENASGAQYELVNLDRIHEYTNLKQEADAICKDDSKYTCFFVKIKRMELGSLKQVVKDGNRISIMRNERILFQETDDRKAFQLGKSTSWTDVVVDKNAHPELTQGHHWHRLVAIGFDGSDPKSMAEDLCHGKEAELTLCLQSDWLSQGARVTVTNLRAGYSKFPDTLKGITLNIPPMCKTAIMGPTGCGKSTFLQCLLRILEPRVEHGKCPAAPPIQINGVDIQGMGLRTLRTVLGLVPQDPVLFSGSLRMNLDPFDEHSDERIWKALCVVKLDSQLLKSAFPNAKKVGTSSPRLEQGKERLQVQGCLGLSVRADGENFSFGQRQLLCIARMILRQPSVLLLDECTSAIDPRTQQLVQETIRVGFPRSTMIAIAHRLETIMDFDQIAVFDRGQVRKMGCPKNFAKVTDLLEWAVEDLTPEARSTKSKSSMCESLGIVCEETEA